MVTSSVKQHTGRSKDVINTLGEENLSIKKFSEDTEIKYHNQRAILRIKYIWTETIHLEYIKSQIQHP